MCDCVILWSKSSFLLTPRHQLNLLLGNTTTTGADLLWSASITNPEIQRYSSAFGWSYDSRTIILNETAFNPSACGLRDAWQIRPSGGLLLTLIYGSASFPLPVMLCVELLSVRFTWCNVLWKDRPCDWYVHMNMVFVVLKKKLSPTNILYDELSCRIVCSTR